MKDRTFEVIGEKRLSIGVDGSGINTLICGHHCSLRCRYCLNPQCFMHSLKTKRYTVDELIEHVKIDDIYFAASGGGVTFGGGEPLLQAAFIHEFAQRKPEHWKINIETSLSVQQKMIEKIVGDVDFWIVDVKSMNPDIYKEYTSRHIGYMLDNLRYLLENISQDKLMVKVPFIAGYTTQEDVDESVRMLEELGVEHIERFIYIEPDDEKKKAIEFADNGYL